MNSKTLIGVFVLVAGILLLYFGYQSSQSVGEQLVQDFTGRFTDSTTWYIVVGAAASLAGIAMLVVRR